MLAEGRLKAAIDLGGNRVVDKGNDTLTPLGLASDTGPGQSSEPPNGLHTDSILSSHLRMESSLSSGEPHKRPNLQEMEDKIRQLESVIEGLTNENKDLEGQNERLRTQSGDTEKFRQRVFELESEQQQMQLKLNEFVDDNERLRKRAAEAESAHQKLLDKEQEESLTLQQANQFYEQENLRLEGQMEALDNRAQKAELAYRKSEQLVISLKDNIKLMRAQMEQVQQQLADSQQQSEPAQAASEEVFDELSSPVDDEETHLEQRSDSELMIDGFPSSKPLAESESEPAQVVQLFAEPSELLSEQSREAPAKEPQVAVKTPSKVEPEKPDISIPVYRVPPKEKPFKERKPLSSFAIASMIMLALIFSGFGYFYYSWQGEPQETASDQPAPASVGEDVMAASPKDPTQREPVQADQGHAANSSAPAEAAEPPKPKKTAVAPPPAPLETGADTPSTAQSMDEEARLQVELTLRQMAEEEFQMRLQEETHSAPQQAPETASPLPAAEMADPQELPAPALPEETREAMASNQAQQVQSTTDSTLNQAPITEAEGDPVTE